jgi:hypothetical protein
MASTAEEILRMARNFDSESMTYERLIDQTRLETETFKERIKVHAPCDLQMVKDFLV